MSLHKSQRYTVRLLWQLSRGLANKMQWELKIGSNLIHSILYDLNGGIKLTKWHSVIVGLNSGEQSWMCTLIHYFNDIAHVYRGQRVYPYTLFCLYNGGDVAIETV